MKFNNFLMMTMLSVLLSATAIANTFSFSDSEIGRISRGDKQLQSYLENHLAAIMNQRINEQPSAEVDEIKQELLGDLRGLVRDHLPPELFKTIINTDNELVQDLTLLGKESFPEIVFIAEYVLNDFESSCDIYAAYIEYKIDANEIPAGSLFDQKIECHLGREELDLAVATLQQADELIDGGYPSAHLLVGDYYHDNQDYSNSFYHYQEAGVIGYGEKQLAHLERLSSTEYDDFEPERTDLLQDMSRKLTERFFAVENYGNAERVCIIGSLNEGCGLNAKDSDGRTELMRAAWSSELDKVEFLIEVGVEVNAQDNDGQTALMNASYSGNADVVEVLLKNGADPLLKTYTWEYDATLFAAEQGHENVLGILEIYVEEDVIVDGKKEALKNIVSRIDSQNNLIDSQNDLLMASKISGKDTKETTDNLEGSMSELDRLQSMFERLQNIYCADARLVDHDLCDFKVR